MLRRIKREIGGWISSSREQTADDRGLQNGREAEVRCGCERPLVGFPNRTFNREAANCPSIPKLRKNGSAVIPTRVLSSRSRRGP